MAVILPGWNTGSRDVYIPLRSADAPNLLPPVWWKSRASKPRCEGWMPQNELCKWLYDRACSHAQPCTYRPGFPGVGVLSYMKPGWHCQTTEGTGMFGFVLCKALTDATCWNVIFLLFQHRGKQQKTILILEISFICFCSIASTHRAHVPREFGCL